MSVRILIGDVREQLRTLPDESVHCVVTSPPYFGLRDYGVAGQIGLEPTPAEFLTVMVDVFREVRRVLRTDGTCWVNLGDSYANDTKWGGSTSGKHVQAVHGDSGIGRRRHNTGLKSKDLIGIPWRVAFALQADGWYLRQDIIWAKPNPMPESVRDRCTKAHEYLFLLTKSPRYYYDFDAMQEPVNGGAHARLPGNQYKTPDGWDTRTGHGGHGSFHADGREKGTVPQGVGRREGPPGNPAERGTGVGWGHGTDKESRDRQRVTERKFAESGSGVKSNASFAAATAGMVETRNKRSVWTVPSEPFREAHFATFPTALIEPCILAGCPVGGTVLDPFFGAGTTGLVADRLQRDCIGIELNPEYAAMAHRRIFGDSPLFSEVEVAA